MEPGTNQGFCYETAQIWQFAGYIVLVLKIIIPAILVILGVIALGKAVISDDTKEIKTAVNGLIKKFIVAVCIFFIPTIVSALFSAINWGDVKPDYDTCIKCIASPTKSGGTCQSAVDSNGN